jgi:hypothetical protein
MYYAVLEDIYNNVVPHLSAVLISLLQKALQIGDHFSLNMDPGLQCCGSRILIFTHPGSRIPDPGSRIPDPKTATKERGEKKLVVIFFLLP